jgi:predicted DNA binding protein
MTSRAHAHIMDAAWSKFAHRNHLSSRLCFNCYCRGMVATGALAARKGCAASELPALADDEEVWNIWAFYVAQLCMNLVLIASPEHISIGNAIVMLFEECCFIWWCVRWRCSEPSLALA